MRHGSRAVYPWLLAALLAAGSELPLRAQSDANRYQYGADRFQLRTTPLGPVTELIGNARLTGDGVDITATRARRYDNLGMFDVVGNVHVISDSLTLDTDSLRVYQSTDQGYAYGAVRIETPEGTLGTGGRGIYKRAQDWLALMDNARIIDTDVVVTGDSITYDRMQEVMEAFGDVQIIDEVAQTVVTGEHGRFERATGLAWVDSVPQLTSRQDGSDPLHITSDWMRFDRARASSRAVGNVDFRQAGTIAQADTADFEGRDVLVLTGEPRVERDQRVMTGDRIDFHYFNQKLRYIEVMGNAMLVDSTPDTLDAEFTNIPLENVLVGDTLEVYIAFDQIQRTYVRGNASSTYLPDDQSGSVSVNEVKGQTIDITFDGDLVDQVLVEGGVEGTYRFLPRDGGTAALAPPDSFAVTSLDSLAIPEPDSLLASVPDSLRRRRGQRPRVDFGNAANEVKYTGQRTRFLVADGVIEVDEQAEIQYDTLTLSSQTVYYDTARGEMLAEGDPFLKDSGNELVGDRMGYLFDHKSGAVGEGATRFDDGFYYGKHIRRPDNETLLVRGGSYTTCDLAEPHYHFQARKMKLQLGERVVARQVVFKVSDIPLMVLPFYFKSLDSGRHSGILFPNVNLGVSSREGRYIRDIGYYWATNDYTDFKFELDYNERRDATFTIENRYNVRYGMSGNARFDYLRRFSDTQTGDRWKLVASHNQPNLWTHWSARSNLNLSSSRLENNNLGSQNPNQLIDTQLRSTGSLNRSFDNGARVGLSLSRTQIVNAEDDDPNTNNQLYSQSLPGLSLSFKTRPLLGALPRGQEGNFFANMLRDMQFSQSYGGEWSRDKREVSTADDISANGRFGLNYAPASRLGPFIYTAGASFSNRYAYNRTREEIALEESDDPAGNGSVPTPIVFEETDPSGELITTDSDNRMSMSLNNSLRTDLYGIFRTRIGPLRGIKHKVTTSASHSFSPQIGDDQQRSQNISFSLVNEFSIKLRDDGAPKPAPRREEAAPANWRDNPDGVDPGSLELSDIEVVEDELEAGEEEVAEKKIDQLIRWSLNTSVNPEAEPGQRWSDIRSTLAVRSPFPQISDVQFNQTFDPYTFEVKRTTVNTSLRLNGTMDLGGTLSERDEPRNSVVDRLPQTAAADSTVVEDPDDPFGDENRNPFDDPWLTQGTDRNALPWSLNARLSITRDRNSFTGEVTTTSNISGGATVRLPGKWSFSYNAGFDADTGEFTNQFWALRRQLHCWQLEFNRGTADGDDFGFKLYLQQIPDLEVTRGDRNAGDVWGRLGSY